MLCYLLPLVNQMSFLFPSEKIGMHSYGFASVSRIGFILSYGTTDSNPGGINSLLSFSCELGSLEVK
jgi:hypothetical protein